MADVDDPRTSAPTLVLQALLAVRETAGHVAAFGVRFAYADLAVWAAFGGGHDTSSK